MTIGRWQVVIHGRQSDLDHLVCHFDGVECSVVKDDQNLDYVLESSDFDGCMTSQDVLDWANARLAVLSGILFLEREAREPLKAGAVVRRAPDGHREIFVEIVERLTLSDEVTASLDRAVGSTEIVQSVPLSPPRTVAIARLAMRDAAVAKAMRLWPTGSDDWVGLYRIYEVVETDVGGVSALQGMGWAPGPNLKRFKRSANSVLVAGDAARHGTDQHPPPATPMTIEEAKGYVGSLIRSWLASKGA